MTPTGKHSAKALLVTSSFLPGRGGIESYLAELCARLAPRLAVLAPGARGGEALPSDLGYPATAGPGRMLWPGKGAVTAVEHAAAALGTAKVVFGTPWPLAILGPRLKRRGLSYAVIVHGAELVVPGAVPGLRRYLAHCLAGADLLLPVSRYTEGKIRTLLAGTGRRLPPIEVLRARVDTSDFNPGADAVAARRRLGLDDDAKVLLCLGRLVPRKGVDRAIGAMPALAQRVPTAVLVIAGTGPEERRLRRLGARAAPARVVFAGRVADADTPGLYAAAEVFLLPVADRWFGLEAEGLGVVLLEASACGTPCVTGRSGGTPEAVLDGVTGYVIDGRDRDELVARVTSLLEDPDRARRFGAAGRAHVQREFSGAIPEGLLGWLEPSGPISADDP